MPRKRDPKPVDVKRAASHRPGMIQATAPEDSAPNKTLEAAILDLCVEAGPGKSICPTDAAKSIAAAKGGDDLAWRSWLTRVRATAIGMARKGDLVIYRKGKPADPDDFRGVYRLGLPRSE